MVSRRKLTVVPPAVAAASLDDLSKDDAVGWLRRMMDVSRDLCDAVDGLLGPDHPAPRPRLTVIPGGRSQTGDRT